MITTPGSSTRCILSAAGDVLEWTFRMLSREPADRYQAEPPMVTWMLFIAAAVASVVFVLAIILAV
jgi:hypothetical protein